MNFIELKELTLNRIANEDFINFIMIEYTTTTKEREDLIIKEINELKA